MTLFKEITIFNLSYIKVKVPVRKSPHGDFIDCNYKKVEESVLKTIIQNNYPITGLEVKFIRHFFGMNMKDFGKVFDITNAAICKWEKKKTPLELTNQIVIRAFVCDKLNIKTSFTNLIKMSTVKKNIVLKAKKAA